MEDVKDVGRPSEYTKEIGDNICADLAMGMSLRSVCLKKESPAISTVFRWLRTYPEFRKQYEDAKQESADAMAEEVLDIADDGTNDFILKENGEGITVNSEHIQRSRLRVDTRKWLMAKMKPKKYGDKLDMTTDGEKINTPILVKFIDDKSTT